MATAPYCTFCCSGLVEVPLLAVVLVGITRVGVRQVLADLVGLGADNAYSDTKSEPDAGADDDAPAH